MGVLEKTPRAGDGGIYVGMGVGARRMNCSIVRCASPGVAVST